MEDPKRELPDLVDVVMLEDLLEKGAKEFVGSLAEKFPGRRPLVVAFVFVESGRGLSSYVLFREQVNESLLKSPMMFKEVHFTVDALPSVGDWDYFDISDLAPVFSNAWDLVGRSLFQISYEELYKKRNNRQASRAFDDAILRLASRVLMNVEREMSIDQGAAFPLMIAVGSEERDEVAFERAISARLKRRDSGHQPQEEGA